MDYFYEKAYLASNSALLSELNISRATESSCVELRIPVISIDLIRLSATSGVATISIESCVEAFATATLDYLVPI